MPLKKCEKSNHKKMVQVLNKSDLKQALLFKNSRYWKVKSLAHTQSQVKLIQVNLIEHLCTHTYFHSHTQTSKLKWMSLHGLVCTHKTNSYLSNDNETVTSYATACPYNGLGIHWPRYVLRRNTLQYSIYGYTLHEQIRTQVHSYTHESGEAG